MCKKKLKKWKLKKEERNAKNYVGCDWVENSAVDFAAVFFSFYHQFPHIKYKYSKKGAKKR